MKKSTHSRNYLGYLTEIRYLKSLKSTHSRNYLGYLTRYSRTEFDRSTHSRNYLGYLTSCHQDCRENLHTVEII